VSPALRSIAGMANRQGDVRLALRASLRPQLTLWLGLAWLGSLGFRLPASCWEALVSLADVVPCFPAGTAGFFFLRAIANLNSLRRAGETFKVEIVFLKANTSCLITILRQGHSEKSSCPSSVWLR